MTGSGYVLSCNSPFRKEWVSGQTWLPPATKAFSFRNLTSLDLTSSCLGFPWGKKEKPTRSVQEILSIFVLTRSSVYLNIVSDSRCRERSMALSKTIAAISEWLCPSGSVNCNSTVPRKQGVPRELKGLKSVKGLSTVRASEDQSVRVLEHIVWKRPLNLRKNAVCFCFTPGISAEKWATLSREERCLAHLDTQEKVHLWSAWLWSLKRLHHQETQGQDEHRNSLLLLLPLGATSELKTRAVWVPRAFQKASVTFRSGRIYVLHVWGFWE